MKSRKPTPQHIAGLTVQYLKEKSDPVRAEGAQRYFKEAFKCYGLTAPQMGDLAKEIYETVKGEWGVEDAIRFCDILFPNPYHEAKGLGILILEKYKKDFPKSLFLKVKNWLASNYLDSWAAVDGLCPRSVGALLEKYPELIKQIKIWTKSPNRWVRRASLVSFIKLAKKKEYIDHLYQISASHFADGDDLIQKANGWLLREAGKADPGRLEKFLLQHGPETPRTTLRYAIERFDEKKRKSILLATRKVQS